MRHGSSFSHHNKYDAAPPQASRFALPLSAFATAAAPASATADTMASAAVASWISCVKELQHMVDKPASNPEAAKMAERVHKLLQAPVPKAALKKLLHDAQVLPCCSQP